MKIQQENIRKYSRIRKIREHFLSFTIPIIQYIVRVCTYIIKWYSDTVVNDKMRLQYDLLIEVHCTVNISVTVKVFTLLE